jgi:hypothetical protein
VGIKSSIFFSILLPAVLSSLAFGQQTIVVSPLNQHGWYQPDTRPGGNVSFVVDMTAPSGNGALRLTTDLSTTAKPQYMHDTNTPLASVSELDYWTKQNVGSPPVADPSYQLVTCLNGVVSGPMPACNGFTTFVFEPYQGGLGAVVPGDWQFWDVDMGRFWSTRSVTCSGGPIVGSPGGPAIYTLSQIKMTCPNAVVVQFGVNIGTNNPMYDVETDLFNFNGTTYDFEPYQVVRNKDECKNGGWRTLAREDGTPFRNQGDCVSYANHNPPN